MSKENDDSIDKAKEQQDLEEEEAKEEEENDAAQPQEGGAGDKFGYSMDDDDEEGDSQDDKDKNSKKSKNKKDDDDNDENDNNNNDNDQEDNPNQRDQDNKDLEDNAKDNIDDEIDANKDKFDPDESGHTGSTSNDLKPSDSPSETPTTDGGAGEGGSGSGAGESGGAEGPSTAGEGGMEGGSTAGEAPNLGGGASTAEGVAEGAEVAEGAAEGAGVAEGAAAGAEVAEGAAAGAEAAGGAAAGAEAAGGAAAGAGAVAAGGTVAAIAGIVILIILIILILIGMVAFFITMPDFLWNKLKETATSLFRGIQGYVIGQDASNVKKEDIIVVGQYLYDMGYDLVGMGFAEDVEIYGQKDKNGNMIEVEGDHQKNEIKSIDAPYLRSYLVAENRTYLINNFTFNLLDFGSSFFNGEFFEEGADSWGTGLIVLEKNLFESVFPGIAYAVQGITIGDFNVGELIKGVQIERSSNTMRIRRLNMEFLVWKSHDDYTYFDLGGWTGRYGKPFELLLTLHIATMAPDLVEEIAMNDDLDAKVYVDLDDTTFRGKVYVDGKSIEELEEAGTYPEEVIDDLKKLERDKASEIKTSIPHISSVQKHWFRNVYFKGTDSEGASSSTLVGVDEHGKIDEATGSDMPDGIEDYNEESGPKTQVSRRLTADDNVYQTEEDSEEEMEYLETVPGVTGKITFRGTLDKTPKQVKDAVRGLTNPTTKELFNEKYYIYDGTVERAKQIQEARRRHDDSMKEHIQMTNESLSAFSILEGSETLDSQFIYRDLKELVIELGYFEREDFDVIEKRILEWPIPEYTPAEWPNRELEKQVVEYGTLVASEATVANSMGISLEELREIKGEDEEGAETGEEDDLSVLNNTLFVGDSYIVGLSSVSGIEKAEFKGVAGITPQGWLDDVSKLPESARQVVVYIGTNGPTQIESMKGLIDSLRERYENAKIYVIEVMHLGRNYTYMDVNTVNSKIDIFNAQVEKKCKMMENVYYITASQGLVANGYLANPDAEGIHITDYDKFAHNIAREIKKIKGYATSGDAALTAEEFIQAAQEVTDYVKRNNFEYGSAEYMPPKNGVTNSDGSKKISCDRMVAWALYKCGYTDQPECGLCVSESGSFIEYCEDKKWKKITNVDDVQRGDIVFTRQLDSEGKKAGHVFICAGKNQRYDCGSEDRIRLQGAYSGYTSQPFNEPIGGDFMCAYRITGNKAKNAGFAPDEDVIAMGNGKVTEIYGEGNSINLFNEDVIREALGGEEQPEATPAEGAIDKEHPQIGLIDNGVRIKLTDNALKGFVLVIFGIDVDSSISVGQDVKATDVIGKTREDSDMCIVLIDRDKAVVEDIEEYIKVPDLKFSSSYNGSALFAQNLDLDPELERLIEEMAGPLEGEYPGIVNILKAISMNESGGGKNPAAGDDPMQAAESLGQAAGSSVGGWERSVEAAINALTSNWDRARDKGVEDLRVVIQSYNYGPGFVDYVVNHSSDKKYTKDLAVSASSYFAAQQGWSSYGDPNYVDPKIYNYLPDLQE